MQGGLGQQWAEPRDLKWDYILSSKKEQREEAAENTGLHFGQDLQTKPGTTSPKVDLRPVSVGLRCARAEFRAMRLDKKGQNLDSLGVINLG